MLIEGRFYSDKDLIMIVNLIIIVSGDYGLVIYDYVYGLCLDLLLINNSFFLNKKGVIYYNIYFYYDSYFFVIVIYFNYFFCN